MAKDEEAFERLNNAIDDAESTSYGSGGEGDLSSDRALAIDYYLGKNVEPAEDGRSQVVDRSVYETIQWILPSLSSIFANGDDVVEIPPVGPEDEPGAEQEAQFLNHVLLQKNNWFDIFNTATKDAMLSKAGYLYPYREERRQVELETYKRQTEQGIALILQDKPDVIKLEEYPDPDYEAPPPQPVPDPVTGQPVLIPPPPPPNLYDITVRRTKQEAAFCIEVLPPERCKIAKTTKTVQLRECPYFEYYDYCTLSELRQDGYEIEDDVAGDPDAQPEEDIARDQFSENAQDEERNDAAMKRVKCRWIWIRYDYDDDGIAELQYVVRVGKKILYREEVNRIPVAVFCVDPLPHRHVGNSLADVTIDVQRIKTSILRQGLDNLYLSNNPRTFASANINLDDLLTSRPGGIVRGKAGTTFGVDVAPFATPFVFPQAMEGLEYMDQVRENRTGTNRYFTGIDQNALNKTATGIQQLSTMAAQRVTQIARHLANGVEELCSILHEIILKSGHKAEAIRLRGQWVEIDPATWRHRTDFRISVGYAAGNKDAMVSRLMLIAQLQEKAMAGGLPIVNPQNLYETAVELTKASDLTSPTRFWQDPANAPPPSPPQPDVTVMAAEKLRADAKLAETQITTQQKERDSVRDFEIKLFEIETNANSALDAERLRIESAHSLEDRKATNQAGLKQIEGQQTAQMKEREHQMKQAPAMELASQVQQMAGKLEEAVESLKSALQVVLTAKRTIKRGKNGQAEGVDVVGPDGSVIASQSIQRGPDGRIAGSA